MQASNPAATGSAGPAFEAKVGAACLALLLTRGAPLCLGTGTLHTVHLQAGHLGLGWHTDDILLEATDSVGNQKAALQAKRAFSISASDEECVATLRGALADFRNSGQFDQQRDVVGLVTSSLSAKLSRGLRTLLDCARASISAADMARRLSIPGYLGKAALGYYSTIQKILKDADGGAPSDDELWHFLSRFHVVDLDLDTVSGLTETMMRSLLAATLPDDPTTSEATWNELIALALSDAGRAMSFTREKLPHHLLQRHSKITGFSTGVSRLIEDTEVVINGIRTTIGQRISIPRQDLIGELYLAVEEYSVVFVTGVAGSGKSTLVKTAFTTLTLGGIGFSFRAVSLTGNHVNEVLHHFGLTLNGLRAQTAMHARKVLWVESLEKLIEAPVEKRAAFLDLLRALKSDPTWRLIVTCRDYSAETIQAAFFGEAGLTPKRVEVGDLTDAELDEVAEVWPILRHPLANQSLRRFLRNPFFLDKATQMDWPVSEPVPANERSFREKVWREVVCRIDEGTETGLPQSRSRALVEVALRRAKALEPFVPSLDLDSLACRRLIRDSILQESAIGSGRYAPAHDVFEDWALMHWLNEEFVRHNQQLDSLLASLGTHPALRRAYRKWLTESIDLGAHAMDPLILALIQNATVASHWREDTLVGILQSAHANQFLKRNTVLLLADGAKLLRQVIHVLRVACRAAIPRRLFGNDSGGEVFLPRGNGWSGAAELMEAAISSFTEADFMLVLGFLEDWVLLTKWGIQYPKGAQSIAKIAWHWLPKVPWRSVVRDGEERLLKVILAIPLAAEAELTAAVEGGLTGDDRSRGSDTILKLVFNHFTSDAVVRDMPDLAFRVAEHLLDLDQNLEDVVSRRSDHHFDEAHQAFGIGAHLMTEDFPASAYHGPYLRMLCHHPTRAVDFIVRLINRACEVYAHPTNRYQYIERPGSVTIRLPDGAVLAQIANGRLLEAYRGMTVTPYCFQSALMALERWLLQKEKDNGPDLDTILLSLLRRSNNIAITGVVCSICAANPLKGKEAAYSLLTCPALLRADTNRSVNERFHAEQMSALGFPPIDAEKAFYDEERVESGRLPHRKKNLEYVAVILQTLDGFRERVWALIDGYKAELRPESEQSREDKLWRIQLHRIDTRNFVDAGRTEEGHIILSTSPPAADLQELIDTEQPKSEAHQSAMRLLVWGQRAFRGQSGEDKHKWREYLALAQGQVTTGSGVEVERGPVAGGPAYIAAVCIRDYWSEMSLDQQTWCAQIVCDSIESDADATDHLVVVAQNPFEGSRPAAFVLPALFSKRLPPIIQARLLPVLAKAVMHNVEETVCYAVQGIKHFLWLADRSLALTCLQALVTEALETHAFWEEQRTQRFQERESEAAFRTVLRSRMRQFIVDRGSCDENQIVSLDLTRWPGRSVAKHLLALATAHPNDSLAQRIMQRTVETLPAIWARSERRYRFHPQEQEDEEQFDPAVEHLFVDAICRFALLLDVSDALAYFAPVFDTTPNFPEHAAEVVKWLILHQGDRAPAPTLWALWQRFADDFALRAQPAEVDREHSGEAKLLRELFLGGDWKDQRDWPPLHGEVQRLRSFFECLPPLERAFEFYAYYLAKTGTPTLPDALVEIAAKFSEAEAGARINETAMFYFEEILTRMVYGGNIRIRVEPNLRSSTLKILDALVDAGSSPAYKLRDDFLTPFSQ